VTPRRFVLKRHLRKKYRCACGGCIETAPGPVKRCEGARYSVDFAIEVAKCKYGDHLPLDRQARIMKREVLEVDSQTLWDPLGRLSRLLEPTYVRIHDYIFKQPALGAYETRWRVMGPMAGNAKKASGGKSGLSSALNRFGIPSKTIVGMLPEKWFQNIAVAL
jgi:transposase